MRVGKIAAIAASLLLIGAGDAMSQWTQITTGLTTDKIMSLAIGPNGYIYAGTYSNGLYRSTDNGATWTRQLGPSAVYEVLSLTVDSSGNVYAGTYAAGLYRSTDNGTSWTLLSKSSGSNYLPIDDIYSVVVSSTGTIFAADGASSNGWVYTSADSGKTWTSVLNDRYVVALATNTAFNPITVVEYAGGGSGFYNTTDDGANWNNGLSDPGNVVSLAARSIYEILAGTGSNGVYQSTDQGANWTAVNNGLTNTYINTVVVNRSGIIYAGTQGGGVFYSSDDGAKWTAENTSLSNLDVRSIAFDDHGNVYAGTYGDGLWSTGDIALAVEMSSYKATSAANSITLSWETRSELSNAGFNILRKKESELNYSTIAGYAAVPSLRGLGTSATGKSYTFTDNRIDNGAAYDYMIEEVSTQGTKKEYGPMTVAATLSPTTFSLGQNYPNPFNPTTVISYQISADSKVTLKVYDVLGRQVRTLVDARQSVGDYSLTFDATRLPSGVYFYRLEAIPSASSQDKVFSEVRKLMVLK